MDKTGVKLLIKYLMCRSNEWNAASEGKLGHVVHIHGFYHLPNVSGKSSWKLNGARLLGSFQRNISRSYGKCCPVFPGGMFQTEFRAPFLKSYLLILVQGHYSHFSGNGTDLIKWQMPKSWTNRFPHVNGILNNPLLPFPQSVSLSDVAALSF